MWEARSPPHHPGHTLVLPLTVGPCTAPLSLYCLSVKQGSDLR